MNEISLEDIKNALQKLLISDLFGNIENQTAILKEDDISAKLKEVNIIDVPDNSILIKIDYGNTYNDIFRSDDGQRKRCDYLLITNGVHKRILLFIEMKSNELKEAEIIQKFLATECLLDYIVSMLNRFHKIDIDLGECKKRFVSFQKKRIPKTKIHSAKDGTKPENYRPMNFNPNKPPTLKSLS
jgi:hypothetical protein